MIIKTTPHSGYVVTAITVPLEIKAIVDDAEQVTLLLVNTPGQYAFISPSDQIEVNQTDAIISPNSTITVSANQYTLPQANDDTLGGIKLGQNITLDEDGRLIYVMNPATAEQIGGVKVGANLSVLIDGTISTGNNVFITNQDTTITGATVFTNPVSVAMATQPGHSVNLQGLRSLTGSAITGRVQNAVPTGYLDSVDFASIFQGQVGNYLASDSTLPGVYSGIMPKATSSMITDWHSIPCYYRSDNPSTVNIFRGRHAHALVNFGTLTEWSFYFTMWASLENNGWTSIWGVSALEGFYLGVSLNDMQAIADQPQLDFKPSPTEEDWQNFSAARYTQINYAQIALGGYNGGRTPCGRVLEIDSSTNTMRYIPGTHSSGWNIVSPERYVISCKKEIDGYIVKWGRVATDGTVTFYNQTKTSITQFDGSWIAVNWTGPIGLSNGFLTDKAL